MTEKPLPFAIIRLGQTDIARARAMNALFAEAFEDADTYLGAPPEDAYLAGLLGDPKIIALVAMAEGEVIGAAAAYELPKFERRRGEIYLYDLAVARPHRRRGVASALIAALKGIAAAAGAWVVFVQADHGDEPAIALYEKHGAREEVLHFDL